MSNRYIHLTPRLQKAAEMLKGYAVVADIGCDHGRLSASLLQTGFCERIIATDISEESLDKAERLFRYIGLSDRAVFRTGNGLQPIQNGECDALAMLGMGGTLMRRILENETIPMKGAKTAVFQPMRAQADIRRYLYENAYHIIDDCIVRENQRYYQVFRAEKGEERQRIPDGWPDSFFEIGYMSYIRNDTNLHALIDQMQRQHETRLKDAKGSEGESRINEKIIALEQIKALLEK